MAMRTVYGTQASGAQVAGSTLDAIFLDIFQLGAITQCSATGTNAIALTATANQAVVTTPLPANQQMFSFVAAGNSSGSVTIAVGAGSAVPWFRADGTTQLGSGSVVGSTPYTVMFLAALNGGGGGFIGLNAGANGVTAGTFLPSQFTIDASGRIITRTAVTPPTRTVLTSGAATYTPPAGTIRINVRIVGSGAGGSGSGTTAGNGNSASATTFGTALLTANGGVGGTNAGGGVGGTATGGDINLQGGMGGSIPGGLTTAQSGGGGISAFGGAGQGNNGSATANSGSGGAGGSAVGTAPAGNGGGAGGYCEKLLTSVLANYAYSIAAGATGGAAGTGGQTGGNGAAGIIIIDEYYY